MNEDTSVISFIGEVTHNNCLLKIFATVGYVKLAVVREGSILRIYRSQAETMLSELVSVFYQYREDCIDDDIDVTELETLLTNFLKDEKREI